MKRLGIMQGRLVPREFGRYQCFPWQSWREEFAHAAADGFGAIELIYEEHPNDSEEHPLMSTTGLAELSRLGARHGVQLHSVCADEFLNQPLWASDSAWLLLDRLLERAGRLGCRVVTIPLLDASSIPDRAARRRLAAGLAARGATLDRFGLQIGLETDLPPTELAQLLEWIDHPRIGVTWDTGNSAALGFDPREELAQYGPRIVSVHIKDRPRGSASVPLGVGAVDWVAVCQGLRALRFDGPVTLQAARAQGDEDDREVARRQATWLHNLEAVPCRV